MKPSQGQESASLNKNPYFHGQWLLYLIAAIGIAASIILYFFLVHFHIVNQHLSLNVSLSIAPQKPEQIADRIPVLTDMAKQYAEDNSEENDDLVNTLFPDPFETILTYTAPIFGIIIILLLLSSIYLMRIARQREQSLDLSNQALKKEIIDRKDMEISNQKLEKALLQGQKLQAIGTLAGGIAHDFNNILYAITGYVEMAQEDVPPNSLVYNNLSKVLEASHRGQDLVSRILTFSRRQHHEFREVNLKSTINSALSLLKPTVPSSVILNCEITIPDSFVIWGDQTQLHQIIVNIINNAVDAMDGEGVVTFTASPLYFDEQFIKLMPEMNVGNYCKIEINDTGYGMDETILERIFEPFFTTKEVGKGTGLGLATAHAIIEEHRGSILVTSKIGHGSTFTVFLPEYLPTKGVQNGKNSTS